jgi:hypothetical protein
MQIGKLIEILSAMDPSLEVFVTTAPYNELVKLEKDTIGIIDVTEEDVYEDAPYKAGDKILSLGLYQHEREYEDLPDVFHPRKEPIDERRYPLAEKLMQALYRTDDMSDEDWEYFDLRFIKENNMSYKKIQAEIDLQIAKGCKFEDIVTANKKYLAEFNEETNLSPRERMFKKSSDY